MPWKGNVDTLLLDHDGPKKVGCLTLDGVENPQEKWPMSTTEKYVFVSHAGLGPGGVKEHIARPTHWFLTKVLGVRAFLDDNSIKWGREKTEELIAPAFECTHALVIFSPAFRERKYCVLELNTFMRRWKNGDGIRVLPALFEMENLDGYHAEVSGLAWKRYGGGSLQGASYSDYIIQTLWPELVREFWGSDACMSAAVLEEHLCRYVELHRGGGLEIPVHLHTFAERNRRTPDDAESGHPPSKRLRRETQEPEPNADNPKVIDAYFAVDCHKPSSWLHNLTGRAHLLADIDEMCNYVKKDARDNPDVTGDLRTFLTTDYQVHFSDGRASDIKNALRDNSRVRIFVWFAKGVDERNTKSRELIADMFCGDMALIDVLVVCMEYGAERIAKAIREVTKNKIRRVVWMRMGPYCDIDDIDVVEVFTKAMLPFCARCLSGKVPFVECMKMLEVHCGECKCHPPNDGETATWHSQEYPIHRSGMPPKVYKQISSCNTIGLFQSRKLRQLKVAATDLRFLNPAAEDCNLIDKLSKGESHRCIFFVPQTKMGEEVPRHELENVCRRSKALTLYTTIEISSCIESDAPGRRISGFQNGIFRVACRKDKESVQAKLKGKGLHALLWLDFATKEMTEELFPNASAITTWIHGFGNRIVLSLVVTSNGKHFDHIEMVRSGLEEIYDDDVSLDEDVPTMEVDCFKLPPTTIGDQVQVDALAGTVKILPLGLRREERSCLLDEFQDTRTMVKCFEKALFGTHDSDLCSVTSLYRDTDDSVIVGILLREVKFLTALRDRGLGGQAGGSLADELNLSRQKIRFDPNSIALLYESMMLQLETLTDHQQEQLAKCKRDAYVHIQAKAGTGKTFIALNRALDYLETNTDGRVLFVCYNTSLAFHFCRWFCCRFREGRQRTKSLQRLRFLAAAAGPFVHDENALLRETNNADPKPLTFGLIIVDEAHHIFQKDDHKNKGGQTRQSMITELLEHNRRAKLLLLSDTSQSSVSEGFIEYPQREWEEVELNEVCRSSKRILLGSRAYQLCEDSETRCAHDSDGLPLRVSLFSVPPTNRESNIYKIYTIKICDAIEEVSRLFPGLDLHHRLAIIVPDEIFRDALCREGGPLLKRLDEFDLRPVTAMDASRALQTRKKPAKSCIVLDTVDEMDGLESLIVLGVGLDQRINDYATMARPRIACARIYRAITRAQMLFHLINEEILGGWFEWLGRLELDENNEPIDLEHETSKLSNAANKLVKDDERLPVSKHRLSVRASIHPENAGTHDGVSGETEPKNTNMPLLLQKGKRSGFGSDARRTPNKTPNKVWQMSANDSSVWGSGNTREPYFDPLVTTVSTSTISADGRSILDLTQEEKDQLNLEQVNEATLDDTGKELLALLETEGFDSSTLDSLNRPRLSSLALLNERTLRALSECSNKGSAVTTLSVAFGEWRSWYGELWTVVTEADRFRELLLRQEHTSESLDDVKKELRVAWIRLLGRSLIGG